MCKLLEQIHTELAKTLLAKVKDKECDAATLNAARQFLKDNDITSLPSANPHLEPLSDKLGDIDEDMSQPPNFKIG